MATWFRANGTGGVLPAFVVVIFMRGITVGVLAASSLGIAQFSGLPQNQLIAARGLGLVLGPSLLGRAMGRFVEGGEAQPFTAALLVIKAICEIFIPRMQSATILYSSFFMLGVSMTMLDATKNAILMRAYREDVAVPLNVFAIIYGLGAMAGPFMIVAMPNSIWNFLVFIDFGLALVVASKRLSRKPQSQEPAIVKVSKKAVESNMEEGLEENSNADGCQNDSNLQKSPQPGETQPVPRRTLVLGLLFLYIVQTCETAMSAWAFTFASRDLELSDRTAAMFPSVFYLAFTVMRFVSLILSAYLAPITILQASATLLVVGTLSLSTTTTLLAAGHGCVWPVLASVAAIAAACCPFYATVLAWLRRQGSLNTAELSLYQTCSAMGTMSGLYLPGLASLPMLKQIGAATAFVTLAAAVGETPQFLQSIREKAKSIRA